MSTQRQYGGMLKYGTENSLYKSFSTNGLVVSPSMYLQQLISQVIQGQWKLWVSSWCFSLTVASCEWETTWECCEQKSPVACLSEKHFIFVAVASIKLSWSNSCFRASIVISWCCFLKNHSVISKHVWHVQCVFFHMFIALGKIGFKHLKFKEASKHIFSYQLQCFLHLSPWTERAYSFEIETGLK